MECWCKSDCCRVKVATLTCWGYDLMECWCKSDCCRVKVAILTCWGYDLMECWCKSDCCRVKVATLTCWGYDLILNIDVSLSVKFYEDRNTHKLEVNLATLSFVAITGFKAVVPVCVSVNPALHHVSPGRVVRSSNSRLNGDIFTRLSVHCQ